ncbi:MAG: GNAT family N-acetyltransferase [Flavobacteriaceae bacterium]
MHAMAATPAGGAMRRLHAADRPAFAEHLLRLDPASRHMRFEGGVSDTRIREYAREAFSRPGLRLGYFDRGTLRAAAELIPEVRLSSPWEADAEAAFSVEEPFQAGGVGTALADRIVRYARISGVGRILLNCLPGNVRMQRIASRHGGRVANLGGDCVGVIELSAANGGTWLRAGLGEGFDLLDQAFDVSRCFSSPER